MRYCIKCGKQNEDNAKFCTDCGTPMYLQTNNQQVVQPNIQNKPVYKKPWFIILCVVWVIFVIIVIGSIGSSDDTEELSTVENNTTVQDKNTELKTEPTTETTITTNVTTVDPFIVENEYKNSCKSVSYETIARDANGMKGQYFTFTGEVLQDIGGGEYRLSVTADEYGYYYDDVIVFRYDTGDGDRILEDDIVTIWGVSEGLETYETILGETVKVPYIDAEYMQFVNIQ